jgi:hypothetical protein
LRWTVSQFEQNGVSSDAQLGDDGPSQHWPEDDPIPAKKALAPKFADVDAIVRQLFDCEGGRFLVMRHNDLPRVPSR